MFKNILIAYDGSEHARKAATLAGDLARYQRSETDVWIVTVMDPAPWQMGEPNLSEYIAQHTRAGEELIQAAAELIGAEVDLHRELLFGTPAESILKVAETRNCDLIVMGARGLSLLEMILLGSQTQKVINQARCPVLVAR